MVNDRHILKCGIEDIGKATFINQGVVPSGGTSSIGEFLITLILSPRKYGSYPRCLQLASLCRKRVYMEEVTETHGEGFD
jgi:hypothetical protein